MPRGNLMFIKQYASFKNIKSPKGGYKTNSSEYLIVLIIPQKIFPDSYWFKSITWRDSVQPGSAHCARPRKIPGWIEDVHKNIAVNMRS